MTNVLPDAFVVLATYAVVALLKSIVPGFGTLPNNAIRGIGFALCYAMSAVNLMVEKAVTWQDLWGLLPIAGALFSTAAILYHIGSDGPPSPAAAASALADARAAIATVLPASPQPPADTLPPTASPLPLGPSQTTAPPSPEPAQTPTGGVVPAITHPVGPIDAGVPSTVTYTS